MTKTHNLEAGKRVIARLPSEKAVYFAYVPLSSPVDVRLSLRGLDGREVTGGSATLNLPGSGHAARFVDELFRNADTAAFEGTLVVTATTSGGKIAATAIQLGTKLGEFTTLPVVPVSPPSAAKELYFAQYANGGSWCSSIFATNGLSGTARGELTVYDSDGNKLAVAFNGQPASVSTPVTIASLGGASSPQTAWGASFPARRG